MDPIIAAQVVSQLINTGRWELVKEFLRRGDRSGATAEVDRALADIEADEVTTLDERTKEDARYKVLTLASTDEQPLLSAILAMQSAERVGQSAEKVGESLVKATWALVAASVALVVATIVLVIITALKS